MSGHKAKLERQRQERIMFGKLCGCGRCEYCREWQIEKVWLDMQSTVLRGKELAEEGRKEWMEKINRS